MVAKLFSNDNLGLTRIWYDVPRAEEKPAHLGLTDKEARKLLQRDRDLRIRQSQLQQRAEARARRWSHHRDDKRTGKQSAADAPHEV